MVIDPALTQDQWHRFTEQAGAIITFKSLTSAKTLGRNRFRIAINETYSPVDQHDPAWINTFTHPDKDCPLGDGIIFPTLQASYGITERIDIGGFWTTAPRANYGAVGGEAKYAFLRESRNCPAAAVRGSFAILTGVPDFNFGEVSLDLILSKTVSAFTPYLGWRSNFAVASETTSKVGLHDERVPFSQGYVGLVYSLWKLNLSAEYNVASVNTIALDLGLHL
jgi:hypothetical protein